jgi:hypothetical protein
MGLVEIVEKKRKEFMQKQQKANMGTLVGLKEMLKKRQLEALKGQPQDTQEEQKQETSDAK